MNEETRKKISATMKGRKKPEGFSEHLRNRVWTEESRKKLSESCKGRKVSEEVKLVLRDKNLGKKHSEETKSKIRSHRGESHPNWDGGRTPEVKLARNRTEYADWRKAVFARDNYTCIICGERRNLNADHIKSFTFYPELRFELDNGRTLCVPCHKLTDNYGSKAKKQYELA